MVKDMELPSTVATIMMIPDVMDNRVARPAVQAGWRVDRGV